MFKSSRTFLKSYRLNLRVSIMSGADKQIAASYANMLTPHEYTISGVKVSFPVKAYPSQIAMMAKIINGLQRGQNSLLESPTGSGKSLALLCAALAWQRKERERVDEYNRAVENGTIEPEVVTIGEEDSDSDDGDENTGVDGGNGFFMQANSQEDFQGFHENRMKPSLDQVSKDVYSEENQKLSSKRIREKTIKRKTVPKIYFGTRTHKQIAQIVRELKKTSYNDSKMTILASREHTCIHPTVSKMKNKNEGCHELIDRKQNGFQGDGCIFKTNVKNKLATHYALNAYRGSTEAWDIEDIVKVGKKVKACPYFSVRELKVRSDIIFCPYNYLIDPHIRKSMEISVKNQVIILDEAHNIEDSAREGASWEVTQEDLIDAMQDLEKTATMGVDYPESHSELASICSTLSQWMDKHKENLTDYRDFNSQSKVWNGTEIVAEYQLSGMGPDNFMNLKKWMTDVAEQFSLKGEDEDREAQPTEDDSKTTPRIHSKTMNTLEGFVTTLSYLYMKDMRHRDDFRCALIKTQSKQQWTPNKGSKNSKSKGVIGSWLNKSNSNSNDLNGSITIGTTLSLNFWCLNPAVVFEELKEKTRSIVLTSGTLSPMLSFSSELDVKFPIQLEANHVIDKKQLWIGTISHGPNNINLNATYQNTESFGFQDEVGDLTFRVCQKVPHGVLLFLPSYKMLSKLSERWKQTGLWQNIMQKKVIISEPRFSDEFESAIRHFYEVIESTNDVQTNEGDKVDGALFIAVCRGKVSEGLDFADNNARAVICVGIPFPNWKDPKVELKMKYNDKKRSKDENILQGRQWYEIQAFRALNQALGRCIRHRKDWGAILMVDDRYSKNQRYINSLSKWVRSDVIHHSNFNFMLTKLEPFVRDMIIQDQENKKIENEAAKFIQQNSNSNSLNKNKQLATETERKPAVSSRKRFTASGRTTSKRGNQNIQYDSDNSNDGSFSDVKINNQGDKNITEWKSKFDDKPVLPTLGSFKGPKNRSEFFSKGSNQTNKYSSNQINSTENIRGNSINSAKSESDVQSPSARLASLAAFAVKTCDIQQPNILNSPSNTFQIANRDESNLKCQDDTLNSKNIPSNVVLKSDIPSNANLQRENSSTSNKHNTFSTPLSDITSISSSSTNISQVSKKKKFKFSPAVKDSPMSSSNDSSLNTPGDNKALISNRYVPGNYSKNYNIDSDDDFQ